jgi:predicted DNA-binding transcriptional regulator YafY
VRADRLLSIMLLLQTHRRLTSRQLADWLEVSPRTIHRDMDALSGAGVPVTAERGQGGGWMLLDGYTTDLTGFNALESQTLFLTKLPQPLIELGLENAAEAARLKLLAALPAVARQNAENARQRLYIDPTGWRQSNESAPLLDTVQDAVWQGRMLRMSYRGGNGSLSERNVHPLGLVAKGSIWYLIAQRDGDLRTYRVSRIEAAEMLDESAIRPDGFDLARYWEDSSASFSARLPHYPVTLRISPNLLPQIRHGVGFTRIESISDPEADGWSTVTFNFGVEFEALSFILRHGDQVEIVEPTQLRDTVVEKARDILRLYQQPV